jgi:hypothetical protein
MYPSHYGVIWDTLLPRDVYKFFDVPTLGACRRTIRRFGGPLWFDTIQSSFYYVESIFF